jgi:hypothetical protein
LGRPEKPLDTEEGPVVAFAYDLRALRRKSGQPSYRQMSKSALFSPSVLSSAANGRRLPTLQVTLAYVRACGGDQDEWERRWRELDGELGGVNAEVGAGPGVVSAAEHPVSGADLAVRPSYVPMPRPAQLPLGPAQLIGREAARAQAHVLVRSHRGTRVPLVVSGRIGVGKSAFVLSVAREIAADFPDGQLYLDLRANENRTSVSQILSRALRGLAVPPENIPVGADESAALIRSVFSSRRFLVVLDNAEAEHQVGPFLADTPYSQILVTSRARMLGLDGVARMEIDALTRRDSVAMIESIVGPARMAMKWESPLRVAELSDGLPLVLSIVAKKLAAHPSWMPADVRKYLTDSGDLVANLRIGTLSLHSMLAEAFGCLSCSAKAALRQIGRCGSAGVTSDDLARCMGVNWETSELLLETLVDVGFLRATSGSHYVMSPLLRLFVSRYSPSESLTLGVSA